MLGKIRLAERRGLLVGRDASRVQVFATEIAIMSETMQDTLLELRSMVPMRPATEDEPDEVIEEEVTEANVDDDGENIVWKMPEYDRDELLDLMADLGQIGSMTVADLPDNEE